MDWQMVIEGNGNALRRILAMLAAMAAAAGETRTLPHHLHRFILTVLRPAEAAARRLVIVVARDLVVALPTPPRRRKPGPDLAAHAALRRLGIAVVLAPGAPVPAPPRRRTGASARDLSLVDPLGQPFRRSRPFALTRAVPRIWCPGITEPSPVPRRPGPGDPVDATRLCRRLAVLAAALDDLPRQALRFARWMARCERARARGKHVRWSPLRPGSVPGVRRRHSRRPPHEVDAVAADLNYFARFALERRDSS
jgi:hypothetical protein